MQNSRSGGTGRDGEEQLPDAVSREFAAAAELVQQGRQALRLTQVMVIVAILTFVATCVGLML